MKGVIKKNAPAYQDFATFRWPNCLPPLSEYAGKEYERTTLEPKALFDIEWNELGQYWTCKREGYGVIGDYGNGSIMITLWTGVIIKEATAKELRALAKNITSAERSYRSDKKHILQKARDKQKDIQRCMDRSQSLKRRIKCDENLRRAKA